MHVVLRTCDVEVRRQTFRRRETGRLQQRLHLEGVGHDDAEERPTPVYHLDGPRRALLDGSTDDDACGATHREEQQQMQRDAGKHPAHAQHGRLSVFEASVWDGSIEQVRQRGSSRLYSHVGLKSQE